MNSLLRKYRGRRTPTLNLTDMTVVSAEVLQQALSNPVVIGKVGSDPPMLLINRETGSDRVPLTVTFASQRQANVFAAGSNAWCDPACNVKVSEVHWSLMQAARVRQLG